ncbi:aminotransferase class IV [Salininema proteolyticum]|uniref:Aminotransferase class IV n=1 Tax=Salininema proteolyticum TaxID=1607685 RepID=A0ABV8TTV9_9ACTN
MAEVTVMLGRGLVPPGEPIICSDDLGVLRGDGVFETINVRGGKPFLLEQHLRRMANSAAALEIPIPRSEAMRGLAESAVEEWNTRSEAEAALRLIVTRGREGSKHPTVFATVNPVGEAWKRPRRTGVKVVSATLGVSAATRAEAPWLLGGVKSISYAATMSVLRWAKEQGADDALWTSSDGYALEGPTSSLVWLEGDELCTTSTETGILPGTTSRHLLDSAGSIGLRPKEKIIEVERLAKADAAWLTSSVRGVVFITELDGKPVAQRPDIHAELVKLSGFSLD